MNGEHRNPKSWRYTDNKKEAIECFLTESSITTVINTPEKMTKMLQECCNKALERRKPMNRTMGKPWWNDQLKETRRKLLAAKRILTRENGKTKGNPSPQLLTNFKEIYLEFVNQKKTAKSRLHETLCNDINSNPWGDAYRMAIATLKPRQKCVTPRQPNAILKALFPTHERLCYQYLPSKAPDQFTVNELLAAATKLKNRKSPGPDGIPAEVIKAAAATVPDILLTVMNTALQRGKFPDIWKTATLKLIPKEGNSELTPKYRPLCMINGTAKLFEHLINHRLTRELENNGGLSPRQHAFRQKRSCITAIEAVTDFHDKTRRRGAGWVTAIILLDVKNAFNSARWDKILSAMTEKGVKGYMINMIASYFESRSLNLGDNCFNLTSGVPQGSVLGPTLWNILIDPVADISLPDFCDMVLYADDIALLIGAKDNKTMKHRGNLALSRTQAALKELGLELATQKTQAILLNGKRTTVTNDTCFTINDTTIRPRNEVKYLGITLDPELNFKIHAQKTCAKATKALNALSAILGAKNARAARRRIIARVVEGQLLYGCEIWHGRMTGPALHELEAVQKRAAVRIARGFKSMSGEAALVLTGMVPLEIQANARKEIFKGEKRPGPGETIKKWQRRWDKSNATWTKSLIPTIEPWINRKHGELSGHLTEVISGHGHFGSFLKMTNRRTSGACPHCSTQETVRHQMMYCPRFDKERHNADLQQECDPRKIVNTMLKSARHWSKIDALAYAICETGRSQQD